MCILGDWRRIQEELPAVAAGHSDPSGKRFSPAEKDIKVINHIHASIYHVTSDILNLGVFGTFV